MNRLRLFISVGICSILFSGCWFFTTEQKQEPKQEVKLEPCDKMPEELTTYLDKIIKGNADNDSVYLRAKETKKSWEDYFTGKRYASSNGFDKEMCEIVNQSWEYAKNYDYNGKKCLELNNWWYSECYKTFSLRYRRLLRDSIDGH